MEQEVVFRIAQGCLNALNDDRVMLPANATENISGLKMILRNLMTGELVLVNGKKESPSTEQSDDENSNND